MSLVRALLRAALLVASPVIVRGQTSAPVDSSSSARAQLIGTWRLDSLAVAPLNGPADSLPDSTRSVLANYERIIRRAIAQFRSGDMTITTTYRGDSTFTHEVAPKGATRPTRERGRWSLDGGSLQLRCRTTTGGNCPHDRARVERVTDGELTLRLELSGRGTGIVEYFRLVRVVP